MIASLTAKAISGTASDRIRVRNMAAANSALAASGVKCHACGRTRTRTSSPTSAAPSRRSGEVRQICARFMFRLRVRKLCGPRLRPAEPAYIAFAAICQSLAPSLSLGAAAPDLSGGIKIRPQSGEDPQDRALELLLRERLPDRRGGFSVDLVVVDEFHRIMRAANNDLDAPVFRHGFEHLSALGTVRQFQIERHEVDLRPV